MDVTTTDTGSTTTGPASFAEAFAADASSASNSVQTPPAAAPSADATAPPAAPSPDGSTPVAGEPPKERWNDILANARTKASEEAVAQWKQQYGWAEQVPQGDLQEAIRIAQLSKADPITYLQDFIKDLQTHPTYGQQLKSLAAKALAARAQPTAPTEPQPDLPIQLEDGRVVQLYSAEQQAKREAWLQAQWMTQVDQRMQPFVKTAETLEHERATAARQHEIASYVETTRADVLTWPGMDDVANQKAVAQELERVSIRGDDPREVSLALNAAYRKVVLPTLASKAQSKQLDDLQRKAAAATSVNPGTAASTSPRPVRSFHDLPADAWR